VPNSISCLTNLTDLDLRSNRLSSVPPGIVRLPLVALCIDHNPVTDANWRVAGAVEPDGTAGPRGSALPPAFRAADVDMVWDWAFIEEQLYAATTAEFDRHRDAYIQCEMSLMDFERHVAAAMGDRFHHNPWKGKLIAQLRRGFFEARKSGHAPKYGHVSVDELERMAAFETVSTEHRRATAARAGEEHRLQYSNRLGSETGRFRGQMAEI